DLNLQARVKQKYFPLLGRGFARLSGDKPGSLSISRLYIPENDDDTPEILLTVKDKNSFSISVGDFIINGKVGELLDERGISLKVDEISAKPGTEFSIAYVSRLKAITDLQDDIAVADQGKDTG
ncbi:tyrosine-protein kinase, partial [Klebsiella pneumoniae]|nr:tyrosine-protein kinase [Klebsiella pneumoniae]